MLKTQKSLYAIGLTFILVVVILVLFIVYIDLDEVVWQLNQVDWYHILIASGMLVAGLFMFAVRWQYLLNYKPPWRLTFNSANIGHMFNLFIPLRAGEAARIVVLSRGTALSLTEVTSSVVIEKLMEQILRIVALGGAISFGLGLEVSTGSVIGALVFLVLAFVALTWSVNHQQTVLHHWPVVMSHLPLLSEERARKFLNNAMGGLSAIASPGSLITALGLSIVTWSFFWLFHYHSLLALNPDFPLHQNLAISLGALALVPPSASTIPGFYHASVVVPLGAVGYAETMLTAYAFLLYAMQVVWMTIFGLLGLSQVKASFMGIIQHAISRSSKRTIRMEEEHLSAD